MKKTLKIMVLYPKEMNTYYDLGNLLAIKHRAELHGFNVKEIFYEPGNKFDTSVDIIIGGGGQDYEQNLVINDLQKISSSLKKISNSGTPILVICELYQLFGHYIEKQAGEKLNGIGIFDAYTELGSKRFTGNIVTESDDFGKIIGYENHNGRTYLNNNQVSLTRVKKGIGNNGHDGVEGCRVNNTFGSYIHGPLLPKNPRLTDELIRLAVNKKFGKFSPNVNIDDSIIEKARKIAGRRPR